MTTGGLCRSPRRPCGSRGAWGGRRLLFGCRAVEPAEDVPAPGEHILPRMRIQHVGGEEVNLSEGGETEVLNGGSGGLPETSVDESFEAYDMLGTVMIVVFVGLIALCLYYCVFNPGEKST